MKQIFGKAFCVFALVLLMNVILYYFFYGRILPYYWGSQEISDKREYLVRNKNVYNTLFLGSSKTHNQIIPTLFDQRAKKNGFTTKSYNFGVGGLTPLESLHIYENLLLKDSLAFKYAFIELDWIATIKYENLNTTRSFYWLSTSNYLWSVSSIHQSSMPLYRSAWGFFHYSLDYAENMLNVGKVQEYIKFRKHVDNQTFNNRDSNVVYNGFIPMFHNINKTESELYEEVVSASKMGVRDICHRDQNSETDFAR